MAEFTEKNAEDLEKIQQLVRVAYSALEEKKATDISIIDISDISVIADYFIVASAENVRQTAALCDNVEEQLAKAGFAPRQTEGRQNANWILLDYSDVIIHIFDKENRLFYDIERIWKDGRKVVSLDAL